MKADNFGKLVMIAIATKLVLNDDYKIITDITRLTPTLLKVTLLHGYFSRF